MVAGAASALRGRPPTMADDSEAMTELAVAQYVLSGDLEYRSEPLVA